MYLIDTIKGRRSIRRYKPDPVSEETLRTVLEAVRWAPSWANTQCSEVVVVRDQDLKSELAKTLRTGNPAARAMTDAPVVVVLCGKRGVSGYYKGQPATEKGDWLMFDTGLAMQNLCLIAHMLGLGTVIVGLFDHKKVAEILKVPQDIEVVAMTPLGYRATEGSAPKRKEVSEFVSYDGYGKKDG
jgi:nitroreductase